MIRRNVDVTKVTTANFDFYNDAKDTIQWLEYDRQEEAAILRAKFDEWDKEKLENFRANFSKPLDKTQN